MQICDGHLGIDAAEFVVEVFGPRLEARLPHPFPTERKGIDKFIRELDRVICEILVAIENEWFEFNHPAGTTVTVALVTGCLLSVVNLGDSEGVLDTGCSMMEVITSHRIQDSKKEQERLKASNCQLAPLGFHLQGPAKPGQPGVGPMRIWPGGLCVARSIGDIDAGPEILPLPHIRHCIIPEEGCRVIISSDGLWDVISLGRAVKETRSKTTKEAAHALIECVQRDLRFQDDTTVIVIDMLPDKDTTFPMVAQKAMAMAAKMPTIKASGGLFSCFGSPAPELQSHELASKHPGKFEAYSIVDCMDAFPFLRDADARAQFIPSEERAQIHRDFTIHNRLDYSNLPSRDDNASTGAESEKSHILALVHAQVVAEAVNQVEPVAENSQPLNPSVHLLSGSDIVSPGSGDSSASFAKKKAILVKTTNEAILEQLKKEASSKLSNKLSESRVPSSVAVASATGTTVDTTNVNVSVNP
jgi:serine/threonine protein phosphatase PrpC